MVHPITLNILCFYTIVLERLTENDILQHHTASCSTRYILRLILENEYIATDCIK